jgi:hypothetical protein
LTLPKGDKGDQGVQGVPGGPVPAGGQAGKVLGYQTGYGSTWQDPAADLGLQTHAGLDSSTASLVNTGGTSTDVALRGHYASVVGIAAPTGLEATDTANIQAAISTAESEGAGAAVQFQPGDYHTNATIVFKNCDVIAPSGTRIVANTGSGAAVQLGSPTQNLTGRSLRLPQILKISSAYGTGVGLQLTWANANEIHVPSIYRFDIGLLLKGDGTNGGYVYGNTFLVGIITSDRANIVTDKIGTGFSTQCTFIGGVYTFGVTGTRVAGTRQLIIGSASTQEVVGQHTFIGCDFESSVAEYLFDCYDSGNRWVNCRWETGSGTGYIRWLDDGVGTIYARNNVIEGGWQAELLNVTSGTFAKNNHILIPGSKTGKKVRQSGDVSCGATVPTAVDTNLDITLTGIAPGQVIEVSAVGHWDGGAPYVFADACTVVGGSPVNYISNVNGFVSSWGCMAWSAVGGVEKFFGGSQQYTVVPGDLNPGGVLTLRLMYRLNSAGTRVLAASGNVPLTFHARVVD